MLSPLLALSAVVATTIVATSASAADGTTPVVAVSSIGNADKDFILAGEDASYAISITNASGAQKYNLSVTALVPSGLTFVSGGLLGTPTVYTAADALPNRMRAGDTPPATTCPAPLVPATDPSSPLCAPPVGYELWVWQNISDLPDTATANAQLVVRPDASQFSVGTDALDIVTTAYTSNDPTLLPIFDGSTSVATSDSHTSNPGTAAASTEVRALRVTKSEPSPEHDLLRGVHQNTTTYEILVENTGEGPTDTVTVTDYLPAGLEYLGAGGVDHTESSSWLYDGGGAPGGTLEYPGAADLTGTPAPAGGTGDWGGSGETVETVSLDASAAVALGLAGAGVYTKVTWTIGTLSGGTPQTYASAAGTAGEYVIRYRAAVPLFENTMDWDNPSGTEPAVTGEQAANLNNNTGASTRHGIGDPDYNFAQTQTNSVTASGVYQGAVADPSDRPSSDDDQVTVEAVDLRVIKEVDTSAFETGQLATYRLRLATSEYTSADGITMTDNVANGLCPAFDTLASTPTFLLDGVPTALPTWNAAVGTDCDYPYAGGTVTGADVQSIDFDTVAGDFTVVFAATAMPEQDSAIVEYTVLQRSLYIPSGSIDGATSSGDTMVNTVEIDGTTTAIPALTGVESASGAAADGVETVADDSRAEITSNFSGLSKQVLERADGSPTASGGGTWVDQASEPFALGDTVWYKVRVEFAADIETRNPRLTDFLPQGVEYVGAEYRYELPGVGSSLTLTPTPEPDFIGSPTLSPGGDPRSMTWMLGDDVYAPTSADRFIPIGSWVEVYIEGRVVGQSASADVVDKPENQAKYQQENVDGDVFFLRDDAAIDLDYGMSVVAKGVRDVDGVPAGGNAFGSNVDGLTVVQGDDVTYRIDLSAPETDLTNVVIWDALPPGILAADVDPIGFTAALAEKVGAGAWTQTTLPGTDFTATVTDWASLSPTEQGQINPAMAGRTIVKWLVTATVPGSERDDDPALDTLRGLTLGYTVTIPDGSTASDPAEITQDYVNDASITDYAVINNGIGMNGDGTSTLVPEPGASGQVSTVPATSTQFEVPSTGTYDPSSVHLPDASIVKDRVTSEILPATDPNNSAGQIVQGETVTFRYTATIPANTSVANAVLADDGVLRWTGAPNTPSSHEVAYHLVSATAPVPSFLTGTWADNGFVFDAATGTLTFPAAYQNASATDQEFVVDISVWIEDRDASTPAYNPDFPNNKTLTNTATLKYDNPDAAGRLTLGDTATVVYIEPNIGITKTANPNTGVAVGDPVTYTVTATNAAGRPKSYDNVIVDTVPVGLIVDPGSFTGPSTPVAFDPGVTTGAGGTITWNLAELAGGASAVYGYTAEIDPATGGAQTYTNDVDLTGYTLPSTLTDATTRRGDRTAADDASITAIGASIEKGVRLEGSAAPFGATVSAPIGDTVEYEVEVTLQPNINYYDPVVVDQLPAGVQYVAASVAVDVSDPVTIDGTWTPVYDGGANTLTLTYTGGTGGGDILAAAATRTVTITYEVLLANTVAPAVNDLDNTAAFNWNTTDDQPSTVKSVTDTAGVDVLNPSLGIVKSVSDATPDPGDTFDYDIVVTNTGTTSAHNMVFVDTVPAGIVVDTTSIAPAYSALTGDIANGLGGTIEWQVTGPLSNVAPGNTLAFEYSAELVNSSQILDGETFTNTVAVDHYESFPTGGRDYDPTGVEDDATVDPAFPNVTLTKTVTSGTTAYAEDAFGWTLTLRNTGDGPAETIAISDVLPPNWEFDAGSAQINRGNAGFVALADPSIVTASAVQTLTWDAATVAPSTPALPAASGSPSDPTRTIVVRFTATPTTAALTDPGVTQPGPVAVPHVNTLSATTTDTSGETANESGSYTGPDSQASAFIHSADVQLVKTAGTTVEAGGPAATGWTVVVSNNGPDTAVGPFEVADTWGALPTGFTVTGVAGTGWTCGPITASGFDCERTNAADTLASGASFPAITITVQVAASFDPADSPIANSATVTATTYDPVPGNNTDDDDLDITVEADLAIVKSLVTASPNAGGGITWSLTASNLGPSDSASTTADPIEITDTIPTWVDDVTVAGPLPTGWSLVTPGPFGPGDTVTIRLADGLVMPASGGGSTVAFTLNGTLDASLPASTLIANTAVIEPGPTTDPDPDNNDSTATTTPGIDTTLDISKTRVAWNGTAWVPTTDPVVAGDPVSYRVEIENTGLADALNVTVTDQVEPYLSFDSFASEVGTWTGPVVPGGPGVDQVFDLTGALVPGDVASFIVTLVIDSAHTDPVVNTVVGDADNSTNQPDDSDNSATDRIVDLGVVKSHSGDAVAGTSLEYTVTVTNYGPSDSSGPIDIVDTLPIPFGYEVSSATVSVSGGAAAALEPSVAGQVLTWSIGAGDPTFTLPVGDTIEVVFNATVPDDLAAQTGLVNSVTVEGPDTDPVLPNNEADDPTTVVTQADMTIVKTVSTPQIAGDTVTYTLTVDNNGPSVARNVQVVDTPEAGLTIESISGSGWTCTLATATCTMAEHPVGVTTIEVVARIAASTPAATVLNNEAVLSWTDSRPGPHSDDDDVDVTVVAEADLVLTKTAVDLAGAIIGTADAGEQIGYLLAITNDGPSDAVGPLTIVDTLPTGFSYAGIQAGGPPDWSCSAVLQVVTCTTTPGLAAGDSAVALTILVDIDPDLVSGTASVTRTNVATATSSTADPDPSNNTDDAIVTVSAMIDLSIVKTHDATLVRIGDPLAFDLAVENAGPTTATDVTVTDTIPAGLEYLDIVGSDPAWSVVSATVDPITSETVLVVALADPIAPGGAAPVLTVNVTVHVEAYPSVDNVAVVTAAEPEDPSTLPDNTSTDPVTVPPQSTLELTKTAVGAFEVGSDGHYRIEVENLGITEDPGPIVVTDVLPAGLGYRSATGAGVVCTETGGTVTCTSTSALAVGDTLTIELVVSVGAAAYPTVVNTAVVTTPTEQLTGGDPDDTVSVTVAPGILAYTGTAIGGLAFLALALFASGGIVYLITRRRARQGGVRREAAGPA